MTNYDKLIAVLEEVFQLNQADLDFGIYRILNQKREEITDFLRNKLVPQVKDIITQSNIGNVHQIKKELDEAIAQAKALGADPDQLPRVKELREQYGAAPSPQALENEIFSHLSAFFKRYYKDGDFISMRRYKKDVYAIPYEGEEVKLYWANHDQYYIKTSEHLKNYAFKLKEGRTVRFELLEASTEKDNRKEEAGKERRFRIHTEKPVEVVGDNTLLIYFTYEIDEQKTKQDKLNEQAADVVKPHLPGDWAADVLAKMPTEKNKNRTLLDKHLKDFTARNTFDYFIHKDLGGFLSRELDFYIKNEVLQLDDINPHAPQDFRKQLLKVQALREIGGKIITFLAQLEDFQKKLWLKKKFVVDTQYCITLDRIPEEFYPDIAANDAQREEWVRLFAINEIEADLTQPGYSEPLSVEFLKAQPFLVLDTAFFSEDFKLKLLATFDNLDDSLNGLLVNSENFQALGLISKTYKQSLKCIYIDPPYNTSATPIVYKNDYKHSSWLSLIENRIRLSKTILSEDGVMSIAIDDAELVNLSKLLEGVFHEYELQKVIVNHYPGSGTGRSNVSRTHEYNLFLIPHGKDLLRGSEVESGTRERAFRRAGTGENNYREGRPNSFFCLLVDPSTFEVVGCEAPPEGEYPLDDTNEGYKRIYPIGEDGAERVWSLSYEGTLDAIEDGLIKCSDKYSIKRLYHDDKRRNLLQSVWLSNKFNATSKGTNLLTDIFGESGLFSYPKSVYTVKVAIDAIGHGASNYNILDYFAGSGTTGHAVINLNREDGGSRRYILVEMGQYFDTVTKPRIQKVIYSADWKDGKPLGRQGSSHAFKYLRLESYEDVLNNLQLKAKDDQQQQLGLNDRFQEEYMLSYLLDVESKGSLLNVGHFENPFDYKLNIIKDNEQVPTKVDLVETFNYLIGLQVHTTERIRGFHVVTGENRAGERILVIWRNLQEKNNADLNTFFQKQQYNTRDQEFDRIYVNGDNNLENLKIGDEKWKVVLIEEAFLQGMFEE